MEHIELPSLLGNDLLRGPRHSPCFDPLPPERKWEVQRPGALTVIPHFSTDGCSYCHFRSGDRWDRRQTVDVLVDGGVSVPELAEAYTAEMAKLDGGDEVRATASDALVFQLWSPPDSSCGSATASAPRPWTGRCGTGTPPGPGPP